MRGVRSGKIIRPRGWNHFLDSLRSGEGTIHENLQDIPIKVNVTQGVRKWTVEDLVYSIQHMDWMQEQFREALKIRQGVILLNKIGKGAKSVTTHDPDDGVDMMLNLFKAHVGAEIIESAEPEPASPLKTEDAFRGVAV